MKPPSENHDPARWLDGEMNEAERASFEELLKHDPLLAREARELRSLSASIRAHLPAEMSVPHADFFNSQIQVRIAQMERAENRAREGSILSSWFTWLRQPWLAAAGAAALAVLGFTLLRPDGAGAAQSLILSSYTPNARVQAHTFHDDSAQVTVLMLDGLDEVPADRKISGITVHRGETEPELAATTLFDAQGARLLTISRDAAGNPQFWTTTPRG